MLVSLATCLLDKADANVVLNGMGESTQTNALRGRVSDEHGRRRGFRLGEDARPVEQLARAAQRHHGLSS